MIKQKQNYMNKLQKLLLNHIMQLIKNYLIREKI